METTGILFLVTAIIAVLAGLFLLFAPRQLIKAGEVLNRVVSTDEVVLSKRLFFGVFLIAGGVFIVYRVLQVM